MQILFVDPVKGAQKVPRGGPQTFDCVGVDFSDAIAIIVARPFFLPMTHSVMDPFDLVVAQLFIRMTGGVFCRLSMHGLLQCLAVGSVTDPQVTLPTLAVHRPHNRRPIVGVGAMPALLIGAAARGIKRIGMFLAFFPPRSETSHPSRCLDPATPWGLTSYSRGLAVACASARHTAVKEPVPPLRLLPVRPYRPHALTT